MEDQAHHRDRLDASFCVVSLILHESKCSFFKTDPRECEGYLYPPQKKLWRRPSVKSWDIFRFYHRLPKVASLQRTGCSGNTVSWNSA